MAKRFDLQTILLVPLTRPPMQSRYLIGLLRQQVYTENIGKKMVIAKPVALIIPRGNKQVASLQLLQQRFTFRLASDTDASHSGPLSRSRMDVWSKKFRTRSG